jgi:hypothetical protein
VLAVAEDLVKQLGDASSCLRRGMWTRHAQAYCYICVLMLLYICPHAAICVHMPPRRHVDAPCTCILLYIIIYVSLCCYICVLMLLYMFVLYVPSMHFFFVGPARRHEEAPCAGILLEYVCPQTAIYVCPHTTMCPHAFFFLAAGAARDEAAARVWICAR